MLLLSELCLKDVVNVVDGEKLGKIIDIDIDTVDGKVNSITVSKHLKLNKLLNKNDTLIPWKQIVKIGGEVIIVNYNGYIK